MYEKLNLLEFQCGNPLSTNVYNRKPTIPKVKRMVDGYKIILKDRALEGRLELLCILHIDK